MSECDQFYGRLKELCEGSADRPLHVINSYRAKWGLEPLLKHNRPERVIRHTIPYMRTTQEQVNGQQKSSSTTGRLNGCGGCRERKKLMNRIVPKSGDMVEKFTKWSGIKRLVDARADTRREELVRKLLANTEILVKSFMRQDSLLRFVQSVRQFYPDVPIRVADDSPTLTEAGRKVQQTRGVTWHQMPFDQGLPAGRNLCVRESPAKYVVVCDDDFVFTADTDLAALLLPLTADVELCGGLVRMGGKDVKNWCGLLSVTNGRINMVKHQPAEEEIEGVRVYRTDITYNFFAVRREVVLRHPWDERFRITNEHLDSFLTWKQAGVKVAYTVDCICNHPGGGDQKYKAKRRRNLSNVLHEKWKVSGRNSVSATVFRES